MKRHHGWGPEDYLDHKGPYCEREPTAGEAAKDNTTRTTGGGAICSREACTCDPSQQPLRSREFEALRRDAWRVLGPWGWSARLFPVAHHVVQQFMGHQGTTKRLGIVFHGALHRACCRVMHLLALPALPPITHRQ